MGDNIDFESRIKELEKEFSKSENQQHNESKQQSDDFGDTNFDIQPDKDLNKQIKPIAQPQPVNKTFENKKPQIKSVKKDDFSIKKIMTGNTVWSVVTFIGLVCFMLFFISAFGHFLLGVEFDKISFLNIIALIFTFIPLIYFVITPFLKPAVQQKSVKPVFNEAIEQKDNVNNIVHQDTSSAAHEEYKKIEDERRKLEAERRELEEKYSKYIKADSAQESLERERRLLNERRFQIENLLRQGNMSWNEVNTLKAELVNIEKELSEYSVRISEAVKKAAAQQAAQPASQVDHVKADAHPNYDSKRKEFEEELKKLKDEKISITAETKKVNKQLESVAKKIELLKEKRTLAHETKQEAKVEQIDNQIAKLKEDELQQKTLAEEVKEKGTAFEASVIDIRTRMANVLTELKSRMTGYNEMQKIYTSSMSLMKKTRTTKPKAPPAN